MNAKLKNIVAIAFGLLFLWIPCLLHAWGPAGQTNKVWPAPNENLTGRPIDGWTWKWLWPWYHNPEDGDSGQTALIWDLAVSPVPVPYMPIPAWWARGKIRQWLWDAARAYAWSAWRNNADGLKYT